MRAGCDAIGVHLKTRGWCIGWLEYHVLATGIVAGGVREFLEIPIEYAKCVYFTPRKLPTRGHGVYTIQ